MCPDRVELFEVGPRDGLQNEAALIPAVRKIALVDALSACGFRRIEVTSFVSPKAIPQLADAAEVMAGIDRAAGVAYVALTPNLRGFEAAHAARADAVAVFASASEGFSRANLNCTVAESLVRFEPVVTAAGAAGLPVRGYISCVTDCPFDGPVPPEQVVRLAARLLAMGCTEISLGDTIGRARPPKVRALLDAVLPEVPPGLLAGHFHDTGGQAIGNIAVCLDAGLRVFDTAIGGLGGCPYAPGAPGNVSTGAVADWLTARGVATGLDAAALRRAEALARDLREADPA
jgi:hydroxymethylglutaryl-CoA lyase